MPEQFLSAYLGRFCTFSMGAGLEEVGIVGELLALDGDWIKVRNPEGDERLLNTRRLTSIRLLPEKQQEKFRRKQNR